MFCLPHPGLTPSLWMTPFEFCDEVWRQKTRIVGLPECEEIMTLAFFRFDTIPACDGRTDGRTDRQTDTLLSQRPARVKRQLNYLLTCLITRSLSPITLLLYYKNNRPTELYGHWSHKQRSEIKSRRFTALNITKRTLFLFLFRFFRVLRLQHFLQMTQPRVGKQVESISDETFHIAPCRQGRDR